MKFSLAAVAALAVAASAYTIEYHGLRGGDIAFRFGNCVDGRTRIAYENVEAASGNNCHRINDEQNHVDLWCMVKDFPNAQACDSLKKRCLATYGGKWVPAVNGRVCKA
ncbi:hypothetical protein GQ42DRAFT_163453 [Ramicandelaber brevisporus]|nr:hypothetical protein GQ42DRAFT_163453 [Ramicandelaber brevisporus]